MFAHIISQYSLDCNKAFDVIIAFARSIFVLYFLSLCFSFHAFFRSFLMLKSEMQCDGWFDCVCTHTQRKVLSCGQKPGQQRVVLILDGNSKIGAHVRSNLPFLICLRHWIRSRGFMNRMFFSYKTCFSSCVRNIF